MSKLAPSLKELINAPFARPGPAPAPALVRKLYQRIAREAAEKKYGRTPWLIMSAATTFTLNSPDALNALHQIASTDSSPPAARSPSPLAAAELIREVGLKCISFNGIPRTINCLGAFRAGLPADVAGQLETRASRQIGGASGEQAETAQRRGRGLWDSVYTPFEGKLLDKLAASHPDLPVHILSSHYAPLLSDPPERHGLATLRRCGTSLVAISTLRAQTGVGPQVLSHIFGLRKAVEQGLHEAEAPEDAEGVERLATDEGSEWILRSVDSISEVIGENFAEQAKL